MRLANAEEAVRTDELTCALPASQVEQKQRGGRGRSTPETVSGQSAFRRNRLSIDFPAAPETPKSGTSRSTRIRPKEDGENRLTKVTQKRRSSSGTCIPSAFTPYCSPSPPPITTPCAWSSGPRDTLRLRLLTVASIKIQSTDSFFIYSSFCLHRINEEAD